MMPSSEYTFQDRLQSDRDAVPAEAQLQSGNDRQLHDGQYAAQGTRCLRIARPALKGCALTIRVNAFLRNLGTAMLRP